MKSILSNRFKKENKTPKTSNKNTEMSDSLFDDLKMGLMTKIESVPVWFEYSKSKQKELIRNFVDKKIIFDNITISEQEKDNIVEKLFTSVSDFGPVQYLLDNKKVSSVMINGTQSVYIEINGKILNTDIKLSENQLNFLLKVIMNDAENYSEINNLKTDKYFITVVNSNLCNSGANLLIKKIKE